jgi:hypothetical protein
MAIRYRHTEVGFRIGSDEPEQLAAAIQEVLRQI